MFNQKGNQCLPKNLGPQVYETHNCESSLAVRDAALSEDFQELYRILTEISSCSETEAYSRVDVFQQYHQLLAGILSCHKTEAINREQVPASNPDSTDNNAPSMQSS